MRDALHRAYVNARLMSAIELAGVCDSLQLGRSNQLIEVWPCGDFLCGYWQPILYNRFSSMFAGGIEIEAEVVLKATKVDGVYSEDPMKNPDATRYDVLDYSEVLAKELKVMDLAAFTLARDHNLPIRIFNMNKPACVEGRHYG